MIEEGLIRFFETALPDLKVYYSEVPQDEELPNCFFNLNSRDQDYPKSGAGLVYSEFDFFVSHNSGENAAVLADTVKSTINNYAGQMGPETVTLARVSNEYDVVTEKAKIYSRVFTLNINHLES